MKSLPVILGVEFLDLHPALLRDGNNPTCPRFTLQRTDMQEQSFDRSCQMLDLFFKLAC